MKLFQTKNFTSLSDEQLMEHIGRGETSAFDVLYERYSRRLLRYFHRMLGDEERGRDMLHDLFLKIVERPELYSPGRRFSTWIFSVAHNMCKNEYRSRQARQPVPMEFDEMPADVGNLLERIDQESFRMMLRLELEALEEEPRTTFLLRYQEGFSIREIGEVLGCPEGTVKSRLYYTIRKLADKLQAFDPNAEMSSTFKVQDSKL